MTGLGDPGDHFAASRRGEPLVINGFLGPDLIAHLAKLRKKGSSAANWQGQGLAGSN